MTVERLEILAADLYKEAEEATPIFGGADKKDWMARKLEEYIEEGGASLEELMLCENSDQVIDILEGQYDLYKDQDKDADRDEVTGVADEEKVVRDAYVNPVADALGVTDYDPVVLNEDEINQGKDIKDIDVKVAHDTYSPPADVMGVSDYDPVVLDEEKTARGESIDVKEFGKTTDSTNGAEEVKPDGEQPKPVSEKSSRTNELADTPETVAIPDDELFIVEETVLIIEDEGIIPENVLKEDAPDNSGCSERNG